MPRIKPFSSYPTLFSEAVRRVVSEGQAIDIPFDTFVRASSWRGQFHAFIGSSYKAAQARDATEEQRIFAKLASRVLITIREPELGKWVVTLQDRDRGWQAEALAGAIAGGGVRQLAASTSIPSPADLGLEPLAGTDGTAAPPTERSEERAAEKDVPLGTKPKGKYY